MPIDDQQAVLRETLTVLTGLDVIPAAGEALDRQIDAVSERLRAAILEEIPAFSESGNPDVLPALGSHAGDHVHELRRLFGGGAVGDFAFVADNARRRAEQKFPLEAVLHAYRCGHKVLSQWMRDAALESLRSNNDAVISAVADFSIEYTDAISTIAASEYVARTRSLAEAEGDRRTELMNLLLSGYDEADGRVARILRRAGYLEQRQSFCVVLSQSVDPREMEHPARAQRLSDALGDAIGSLPVRKLLGIRDNVVTAVVSATRRMSGWTAPQTTLAERLQPKLLELGTSVLVGVSTDQPSTSHIPKGLREAQIALDFASVGERVVQFSDLPLRRLLLHMAGDSAASALPAWTDDFLQADDKARGALVNTLRAYANADMNVLKAARELAVHPNTIYTRMQRIQDITGLDGQRYNALTELLLAVDCRR